MTRAIVVFSDGSKKMAHNLDDSIFRWYERKVAEIPQEIVRSHRQGITIRDCTSVASLEQEELWRREVSAQFTALSQQIQVLKSEGIDYYKRKGHQVRIAMIEVQQQLKNLKQYRRDNVRLEKSEDKEASRLHTIRELRHELLQTQRQVIKLQCILLEQFGIDTYEVIENEVGE